MAADSVVGECKKNLIKTSQAKRINPYIAVGGIAADCTYFICVANVYFRRSLKGEILTRNSLLFFTQQM